jgi:diguanylate cyclase (GGDEF)-like protein
VIVPLRPKGQVLGVIIVVTEGTLAADQCALLGQAAEQLALAIDSAALYRQATERAARIQVLSHLARIVASVADLREAFGAFADEVRWLIPFDSAVMMLVDEDADTVELYAAYPAERDESADPVRLPGSLAQVVIDAGGPVALARDDPRFAQLDWSAFEPDVKEVAAVPVMHGSVCTAIFALARDSGQSYVVEEFIALEEVAGLLAVTIERLRLYERAEHNARHDLLTGLPNQRYLNEHLESLRPALEDGGRAAVFLIDMDGLKIFNDTLGHEVGDRVIQIVAREIRAAARAEDFVARVGGDEFVLVMADAGLEAAVTVAERVHQVLWEANAEIPSAPARVSVSTGIAVAPDDGIDPTQLLSVADRAMYEAKFAGGRRTRLARDRHDPTLAHLPGTRANRVVEALVGAATAGASQGELAALALAERLALAAALQLGVPAEATPPLRILVAAIAAQRLSEPRESMDQSTALMLVDGLHREWASRAPRHAAVGLALVPAAVTLAWELVEPPVGSGASLDAAVRRLRERPPDGSTPEAIEALVAMARSDALERRGDEGRAA